jgi:hypothetical protein
MRNRVVTRLAVLSLSVVFVQSAGAGSAVAIGNDGQHTFIVKSFGLPRRLAVEHVIDICRRKGDRNARLVASSDVVGYGSIAVGRRGAVWVVGVSLGRRSASESDVRAIRACVKAGGINPKVKWGFRG